MRGAGAGMFARWAECSPTSESSPLERNPCPPQQENVCACTEAQRLSRSSLASKLQVLALRLLVAKDESFAFGSASSVGRPGQPSPSELVDGFDDSTVSIKERRARGRGGSPRPDHPIRSNRQAWFCSQSNFVTFVYPSDGSPFGGSLGTDSLCVD